MRQTIRSAAIALAVAALAGCGSTRPSKYYQLEVPATPPPVEVRNIYPVTLLVGRIGAPHILRDDRIAYRTGPVQMGTYEYHRWAEPPTEMVEGILMRLLRASGRYRGVQPQRSNARGDFIIRGRLHEFEEVSQPQLAARVAMEFELDEIETGTTVWSQFYSHDEPANGKDVPAVVEALERNVQRGLQQVAAGLDQYFATHPPK